MLEGWRGKKGEYKETWALSGKAEMHRALHRESVARKTGDVAGMG
ncbi:MAG: hypothetical protein ACLUHA_11175 [Bacteroides stercoris]